MSHLTGRGAARGVVAAALGLALGLATTVSDREAQAGDYLLATAGTGGTYYPVGVAIGTLSAIKLARSEKITISAITSAGSGENVKLLEENQVQFAIVQGLWGAYAANGDGPLDGEPLANLRAVTTLWPNVEHFGLRSDQVSTGTIQDLIDAQGTSFAIGARNSGTEGSNRYLLGGLGIGDPESHFSVEFLGYGPSADAFQNGAIDAVNPAAGPPVGAMTRLMAAVGDDITILDFTEEQLAAATSVYPGLYTPYTIPAGTYPSQDEDITTIAQPNFLAVRADVPEEDVYKITQAIYENLGFLNNIHPATRFMSLEGAVTGLPLTVHPGAARYYEESGITIPDSIKP